MLDRASSEPRRAVFDAFELLNNTVVSIAKSDPNAASRLGFWPVGDQAVAALVASNLAHPALPDAFRNLAELRDLLQSDSSFVPAAEDARRYVELARTTAEAVVRDSGAASP